MGIFGSSEESVETKAIDTNGQVNNNIIIIQEAKDTHSQMVLSEQLRFGTYILIGFEVIKVSICLFSAYRRHIKKKYNHEFTFPCLFHRFRWSLQLKNRTIHLLDGKK